MGLENIFLHFKKPHQFIYFGDDYVELFEFDRKKVKKIDTIENISVSRLTAEKFLDIHSQFRRKETGIILTSQHFIFNIFDFEKIPIRESLKRDLMEWKIKRVFPENIEQYEHQYFKLDNHHILSILFRKSLKEKIENLVSNSDFSITYLGSSTVEIMNNIFKGRLQPDFFIEMDKHLAVVVFQNGSTPFYIRKFRIEKMEDVVEEIQKTIQFVRNNYSKIPRSFALISNSSLSILNTIRRELSSLDIEEMDFTQENGLFLPGKK